MDQGIDQSAICNELLQRVTQLQNFVQGGSTPDVGVAPSPESRSSKRSKEDAPTLWREINELRFQTSLIQEHTSNLLTQLSSIVEVNTQMADHFA